MKTDWIATRLQQRNLRLYTAGQILNVLNSVWHRLPETIGFQLKDYRNRVAGTDIEIQTTKDKYVVRQTIPVRAGVTITRNEQRSSILASYDNSTQRSEFTVAFAPFTGERFDGLLLRILEPVLFPDLRAMDGQIRWEDIELKPPPRLW